MKAAGDVDGKHGHLPEKHSSTCHVCLVACDALTHEGKRISEMYVPVVAFRQLSIILVFMIQGFRLVRHPRSGNASEKISFSRRAK